MPSETEVTSRYMLFTLLTWSTLEKFEPLAKIYTSNSTAGSDKYHICEKMEVVLSRRERETENPWHLHVSQVLQ